MSCKGCGEAEEVAYGNCKNLGGTWKSNVSVRIC